MLLAHAHQLLSLYGGNLSKAMERYRYWLRITHVTPRFTSWETVCYGSQGRELLPRYEHACRETEKIPEQIGRGYLCSFDKLLKYVEKHL